jgi:NAD(P)-dependent dehydrogenase (short-subunit alcohol dehydrogenase family)
VVRVVQWGAYGQSKLANLLHAQELDHRCQEAKLDIRAHSLHPGVIQVGRHIDGVCKPGPSLLF